MASQERRKAQTRRALLDAAATLFAERGTDAVSVDAVAEAAGRTSGAVYAHFGGKDGLLAGLAEELKHRAATVMAAELAVAGDPGDELLALWRSFAQPSDAAQRSWMLLEHELWLRGARDAELRPVVAARFDAARQQVAVVVEGWQEAGRADPEVSPEQVGALLIAVLVGLEMQHRLEPGAVTDEAAVAALRAVTGYHTEAQPAGTRHRRSGC